MTKQLGTSVIKPADRDTYIGRARLTKILMDAKPALGVGFSVSSVEMPPGGETEYHEKPQAAEVIYAVEGRVIIGTAAGDRELNAGDMTIIEPGTRHCHRNPDQHHMNKFLVILTPNGPEQTFRARKVLESVTDL